MTTQEALEIVSNALEIPASQLSPKSRAVDHAAWDSMGVLSLMHELQKCGVEVDLQRMELLQSVEGILELCAKSGPISRDEAA